MLARMFYIIISFIVCLIRKREKTTRAVSLNECKGALVDMQVIEYIQFLQEKLHMYEGTYQGWSQEPTKLMPWVNNLDTRYMHALVSSFSVLIHLQAWCLHIFLHRQFITSTKYSIFLLSKNLGHLKVKTCQMWHDFKL